MNDDAMDPRYDKLVAALYGELSGREMEELEQLLSTDDELRAAWDELRSTRRVLGALDAAETAPSFVFLADEEPERVVIQPGPWGRFRAAVGRWGAAPAWGLAAAALLALVLGLGDFRVQKLDGGFAFRFGSPPPTLPVDADRPITDQAILTGAGPGGVQATPAGYLTRGDLEDYESQVLKLMGAMLEDYSSYRDQELAGIMRTMYAQMNNRQDQVYDDLRGRIEAVNVGLLLERTESDARYREILDKNLPVVPTVDMEDRDQ